jgi:hypothetical protein
MKYLLKSNMWKLPLTTSKSKMCESQDFETQWKYFSKSFETMPKFLGKKIYINK